MCDDYLSEKAWDALCPRTTKPDERGLLLEALRIRKRPATAAKAIQALGELSAALATWGLVEVSDASCERIREGLADVRIAIDTLRMAFDPAVCDEWHQRKLQSLVERLKEEA